MNRNLYQLLTQVSYLKYCLLSIFHTFKSNLGSTKVDETGKTKAELKAERRQKQEAQRASKAAGATEAKTAAPKPQPAKRIPDQIQADRPNVEKRLAKRCISQKVTIKSTHTKSWSNHMVIYFNRFHSFLLQKGKSNSFLTFNNKKELWVY